MNFFNVIKIIVMSETITTIWESTEELHIRYVIYAIRNNFLPVMTHKASADDNHSISKKIAKK